MHSNVSFDKYTQLGSLHFYLPIDRRRDYHIEDISQLCLVDGWDADILQHNFAEEICEYVVENIHCVTHWHIWDKAWWMLIASRKFKIKST